MHVCLRGQVTRTVVSLTHPVTAATKIQNTAIEHLHDDLNLAALFQKTSKTEEQVGKVALPPKNAAHVDLVTSVMTHYQISKTTRDRKSTHVSHQCTQIP